MKSFLPKVMLAAVVAIGSRSVSHAAAVALTPVLDNSIFSENDNSEALGNLFAGRTAGTSGTGLRRALMMFDVAGNIAAGATINSVTLTLTQLKTKAAAPSASFEVHPLTDSWGEGTSSASGVGRGSAPTTGDATWNYRFYNTTHWTNAGGDFGSTSGTALFGTGAPITDIFNSQAGMVTDVQNWLNSPGSDFGWILLATSESTAGNAREFGSRFSTLSQEPTLTINFTVPAGTPAAWRTAVNGNWTAGTNWNTGAAPNAAAAMAVLNKATTAALTVTLDSPQTVGKLTFGNSASASLGYSVTGTNTLTLNNSGSNSTITVTDGTHVINTPVALANGLVVNTASAGPSPWTLTFGTAGGISQTGTGSYSLTMSGTGGKLILSGTDTFTGGTIVTAGTVVVTSAATLANGSNLTVGANATKLGAVVPDPPPSDGSVSGNSGAVPEPGMLPLLAVGAIVVRGSLMRHREASPPS
jgi:autotransporter-associated beta strand protein